jgi:hypothetical protein
MSIEDHIDDARDSAANQTVTRSRLADAALEHQGQLVACTMNAARVCLKAITAVKVKDSDSVQTAEEYEDMICTHLNVARRCVEEFHTMPMLRFPGYLNETANNLRAAEDWLRVVTEAVARLILCISVESIEAGDAEAFVAKSRSVQEALEDARQTLIANHEADKDDDSGETLMEAFARAGMLGYNEAQGCDTTEPEPCGHHCGDDCPLCGQQEG